MNARVFPDTHGRPAPARRSLVYWEWIKNDQRVLAAGFLLPALLILASVVIYPFPPDRVLHVPALAHYRIDPGGGQGVGSRQRTLWASQGHLMDVTDWSA